MPSISLQTGRAYGKSIEEMRKYHGDSFKMYDLAVPYVQGKYVLDIACGTGTGTAFLAQHAAKIVGADIDEEAIAHCTKHHAGANIEFLQADATKELPFAPETFEVITTFETIEHLYPEERAAYLKQLHRVLRADGIMVLSTPQNGIDEQLHEIPPVSHPHDHKIEFHLAQLKSEVADAGFDIISVGGIRHHLRQGANSPTIVKKSARLRITEAISPVTRIIPPVIKQRIGARILGYPFHIDKFSYIEHEIETSNTFFMVLKKKEEKS